MKRTTIFLEESLERDLQAIARQEDRPVASLVREALATYVAARAAPDRPALSFLGVGASEGSDGAERHEELLWREERKPRRPGRPARQAPRPRR